MSGPNQCGTRRLRDCILASYSGALVVFLEEAYALGTQHTKPLSPKALEKLLREIRPNRRIFSHAVITPQKKADGTKRMILVPGIQFRRAQRLVGHVLEASNVANPYEYNSSGRGAHVAIAEVARLAEKEGIEDFVMFDLKNYFTSVDAKHLKGFHIPKKVMRHSVLFNRDAMMLCHHNDAAEAEAARQGLPQGARVSGILASSLLGRELRQLDGAMGIVAYGDDVVIGACDPTGAKSLAEAVKLRFANHPGGPLSFKALNVTSIRKGFAFLGYYLWLDKDSQQPRVLMRPSHEAREKFRRKLMGRLGSMLPKPDWDQAIEVGQAYGKNWRQAFAFWQPDEAELQEFQSSVECLISDFFNGFTSKHVLKLPVLEFFG